MPPLSLAAGAGSVQCVAALLAAGAQPGAVGPHGATALHVTSAVPGRDEAAADIAVQLLKVLQYGTCRCIQPLAEHTQDALRTFQPTRNR